MQRNYGHFNVYKAASRNSEVKLLLAVNFLELV